MNSPDQKFETPVVKIAHDISVIDLQRTTREAKAIQRKHKANKEMAIDEVVGNFLKSLKINSLTLEDVAPLLFPELTRNGEPPKVERRGDSTVKSKLKSGTVYQDPNSSETWTAGGKGARPKWIQKLLKDSVDMSSLVLIDSPQS